MKCTCDILCVNVSLSFDQSWSLTLPSNTTKLSLPSGKWIKRNSLFYLLSIFFQCHINSHTGVRPFHCSTCQKSFRYSSTLKNHIRLHSEKPYKCQLCNEVFLRHDTLVRHEFRHTGAKPFECDICKATFAFKDYLKCHMRKHLGNKAVSCPTCGRECCDYNSLRRHLATHTGMKNMLLIWTSKLQNFHQTHKTRLVPLSSSSKLLTTFLYTCIGYNSCSLASHITGSLSIALSYF